MTTNIDQAIDYYDTNSQQIITEARGGDSQAKAVIKIISQYLAYNQDVRLEEIIVETMNNYIDDKKNLFDFF